METIFIFNCGIDGSNACIHFVGASHHGVGVQLPLAPFFSFISSSRMETTL